MKLIALILFIFITSFAFAQDSSDIIFCKEELNKEIENILKDDSKNLLDESFNLAALKYAYRIQKGGGSNQTVETYIRTKHKELTLTDKNLLIKKVSDLYQKFGKKQNTAKISSLVEDLKSHKYFPASKRLSNEEHSVVMLALKQLEPCENDEICIDDNDISVTWFMDTIAKKAKKTTSSSAKSNLLSMSVKFAHINGALQSLDAINGDELIERIKSKQYFIDGELKEAKNAILAKFERCKDQEQSACVQIEVKDVYSNILKGILDDLNEQNIESIPDNRKLEISKDITLNLKKSLTSKLKAIDDESSSTAPSRPSSYPAGFNLDLPAEFVDGEKGAGVCGGDDFTPGIKDVKLWSFDPLRVLTNAKKIKQPVKELGLISALCELVKAGPIGMHCYTFVKKFVLRRKTANASVCCQEKVQWKEMVNLFASIGGGAEVKGYLGVPLLKKFGLVAEVGLMGGASLGFSVGGGGVPEGCITKNCIQAAIRTSLYLGGYVDIGLNKSKKLNSKALDKLNKIDVNPANISKGLKNKNGNDFSLVGGELKLSFKPYVTGRQCLYPVGDLPPAEVRLSLGSVWLHGTLHFGWMFSRDLYRLVYKNEKEDNFSIPIF